MNLWVSITIGPHDRPAITVMPPEDGGEEGISIRLSDGVTILGDRADIERWVRDLAAQVALSEAT